ncbi:MAG TPA: VWA domain-containing protein, partial [Armatimonadota bacterium]|jgi:hypothetical protein
VILSRFFAISIALHLLFVFTVRSPLGAVKDLPDDSKLVTVDLTASRPPVKPEKPQAAPKKPKAEPKPRVKAPRPKLERARLAALPKEPKQVERRSRQPINRGIPWTKPQPAPKASGLTSAPHPDEPGGSDPDKIPEPLPKGLPIGKLGVDMPRVRLAALPKEPGGGSPAMGPVPGGKDGFKGPEKQDDLMFNGGGAGGLNLPKAAPRMGGGGGQNLLAARNLLTEDLIREEKPGTGPGRGGGMGAGAGGGVGFATGKGIGVSPTGLNDLATLRRKAGEGIGAGQGRGIGTYSPGGGKGTGSMIPGTGGTGMGYGRGSGIGVGNGSGGRGMYALRGIPFGDPRGLLGGNPNGGGGVGGGPGGRGPGGGDRFGVAEFTKEDKRAQKIVYVLDCSSSMRDKIAKAKGALKEALAQLRDGDEFNIITFNSGLTTISRTMLKASKPTMTYTSQYIDGIGLSQGTYMSGGLQEAFSHRDISTVVLISDGEPSKGVTDPEQLLALVRAWNHGRARLLTIALGVGKQFQGVPLLSELARQNRGQMRLIDLSER